MFVLMRFSLELGGKRNFRRCHAALLDDEQFQDFSSNSENEIFVLD